jgi:hypothetical protein
MSATVLDMSMSLDGFIAGPNETRDHGLGDGGMRLHEWVFACTDADPAPQSANPGGVNGRVFAEVMATGAVVAGRGTVEPAGYCAATTTTPCRSSSSAAESRPPRCVSGRGSPS